ncbi:SIR2 family protein [Parasphingorhabdus sp.]|uniref:SIR2 family protein n=1 Tax=Parasphingorhabdus sp. TaxID=2709688 RepID=UPI003D29DBF8
MFRKRTTVVVGAGASSDFGLPLGTALKEEIGKSLNISFRDGQVRTGDPVLIDCIRLVAFEKYGHRNIKEFLGDVRNLSNAMPLAISIDHYLHAHEKNEQIKICGKLAIARSILLAERKSSIWSKEYDQPSLSNGEDETWLEAFFRALNEDVTLDNVDQIFSNVAIISFNYDRCIKHFLKHAIKSYYSIGDKKAEDITRKLEVIHPYGSVGELPWEAEGGVPFGLSDEPKKLLAIARSIKTFSESVDDVEKTERIQSLLSKSKQVLFLGFGFHKQNMDLLVAPNPRSCDSVYASAIGLSESNIARKQARLVGSLKREYHTLDQNFINAKCRDIFNEYWDSLLAS